VEQLQGFCGTGFEFIDLSNILLICPLPKSVDIFAPFIGYVQPWGVRPESALILFFFIFENFVVSCNLSIVCYALNMCPQGMYTVRRTG
jgi:hypothetical protein